MPPMDSQPQHLVALDKANQVRIATANLKKEVKRGEVNPVTLILETPTRRELEKVSLLDFLTWVPYIGESKARQIMRGVVNSPTLKIVALSERTRREAAESLDGFLHSKHRRVHTVGRMGYIAQPTPVAVAA